MIESDEKWSLVLDPERSDDDNLRTAVFQSLGAASMCWEDIDKAGVFLSDTALEIGNVLIEHINNYVAKKVGNA